MAMPLLRRLDAETAHHISLAALRLGLAGADASVDDKVLAVPAFGRVLCNPIGLAAGFDKNAAAVNALARLGFGFIEAGTVTPLPQPGNPRPRLFRLAEARAVINRMGFNNQGIDVFLRNLGRVEHGRVVVGANLGINKTGAVPERDYPALAQAVAGHADYITINISSPNTPDLRNLQGAERLGAILEAVQTTLPLFVKIAPDLDDPALEAVVRICIENQVSGLIISNTTVARPDYLTGTAAREAGGLSGAPLMAPSTEMLRKVFDMAGRRLMLIGVGGIFSADDAFAKILAGASLVQVYTSFAMQGPALLPRLKSGLSALLKAGSFANVADAVGARR